MTLNRHISRLALFVLIALAPAFSVYPESKDEQRLERRAAKIASTIANIQVEETSKIPASVMEQAEGIIVLRQYEAGFVLGAKGGFGMAMKKQASGRWGPPAWIKTGEISGGLQIGVQTLNVVLLVMDERGMKMLQKPKFRIGVDATVTAGPTGSNVQARIGNQTSLLAYTETEGLYAGATFEGGFLLPDNKSNLIAYGESLSVPEIISGSGTEPPAYAAEIIRLLQEIEIGYTQEPNE